MSAAVDTMILVFAGLAPANSATRSSEFEDLRIRSLLLFHQLADQKKTICISTITISELLVPVPAQQKGPLVTALSDRFLCAPFDLRASVIAAELWTRHKMLAQNLQYQQRQVLKSDCMIVASAIAGGATEFYSHDANCRSLAGLLMPAHDLPPKDTTLMGLFLAADIKAGEDPPAPVHRAPKHKARKPRKK